MGKQSNSKVNINLAFTADAERAKRQLKELQNQLSSIVSKPIDISINDQGSIQKLREASIAAAELKVHLDKAINTDTGNLDFSKLNQSLKTSNKTLDDYAKTLQEIGPEGKKAFLSLAQSVAEAEVPIKRSNEALTKMWDSLKNTARWQISSSILHGFMGAVQSAYGYAQDLNESLNNIRIVTGQNTDQMADFAKEANKAAKALSTTTTEYTKASLIYYQQGLSDKEVKDRTDVTVKMANVARSSAEDVSDQLTAVWNNFYDGTKTLEYYADVMTALGAATASSTEEISVGLNKFAAIAESVGLSYEYAASALATVTATTRQSADIVGTAFKTLFARMQDLELGETLDDGTTMGKYSQALAAVGVNIKTATGEMKDMDLVLEELAARWDNLASAEKVALAQTVAGTRQYTQLIALMDNWDFMEKNIATSKSATGTLDEQADIYAESWEAASDRVQASMETIYQSLLNDEFFIDLLNGIDKALEGVDNLIDSLGGVKGVLAAIGAIATKAFESQIAQSLTNLSYNLMMSTDAGRKKIQSQKTATINKAQDILANMEGGSDAAREIYGYQLERQQDFIDNQNKMNENEKKTIALLMEQLSARGKLVLSMEEAAELAANEQTDMAVDIYAFAKVKGLNNNDVAAQLKNVRETSQLNFDANDILSNFSQDQEELANIYDTFAKMKESWGDESFIYDEDLEKLDSYLYKLKNVNLQSKDGQDLYKATAEQVRGLTKSIQEMAEISAASTIGIDEEKIRDYGKAVEKTAQKEKDLAGGKKQLQQSNDMVADSIKKAKGAQLEWADVIVRTANLIFSVTSVINMFNGAIDTLKDPDASGWEKFSSVIISLSMALPTLITIFKTLKTVINTETLAKIANVAATLAQVKAEKKLNKVKDDGKEINKKNIKEIWNDTKEKVSSKWNEASFKKKYEGQYTQHKNGTYRTIKGQQGALSKEKAAELQKLAGKEAFTALKTTVGGFALIAAGILVAVGAISWGIAQFNKHAKEAEKASQVAKKAADVYRQVSEAYNTFTSNLSAYEEAQKGLEGLTKGTLEYREAILKANESALQMLNTYKGLSYTTDAEGRIVITKGSLEDVKKQQLDSLQNAQYANQLAQQNKTNTQLKNDMVNFNRKKLKSGGDFWVGAGNTIGAMQAGALSGTAIGAGIGTLVGGPVGTVAGAAIGNYIGKVAGLATGVVSSLSGGSGAKRETKVLEDLQDIYNREGSAKFASDESFRDLLENGLNLKDEALINSLVKNRESTLELVTQMEQNTQAIMAANEQVIKTSLGEKISNIIGEDNEVSEALISALGSNLGSITEKEYKKTFKDKAGNLKDKEIQKMYAAAMGWDTEKIDNLKKNQATYYDKEGNIVAEKLDDEIARRFLAQQEALNNLDKNISDYIITIQKVVDTGNKLGDGIGNALLTFAGGKNGTFESLTQSEFNNLNGQIKATKGIGQKDIILTIGDTIITPEQAKDLGWKSAEAYYKALIKVQEYNQAAWDNINTQLFANSGLTVKLVSNMTLETAQALEKQLNLINLGPAGEQAGKKYIEGLNKMISGLDSKEQQEALNLLSKIDWTSTDALKEAKNIMKEYGVEIDLTSASWQTFAKEMQIATGAIPDFSDLQENLQNISKILKDLNFGSIIDDEEYQKLIDYNSAWKDFFIMQADGTRQFIGDSKQLKTTLKNETIKSREEQINRLAAQEAFLNSELGSVDWTKQDVDSRYLRQLAIDPDAKSMLETMGYSQSDIEGMNRNNLAELMKRIANFKNENIGENVYELDQQIASLAKSYSELIEIENSISEGNRDKVIANQKKAIAIAVYNESESIYELINARKEAEIQGVRVSEIESNYQDGLLKLAEAYDTCAYEAYLYNQAINSGDGSEIEAAELALQAAIKREAAADLLKNSDVYDVYRTFNKNIEAIDEELNDLNEEATGAIGAGSQSAYDKVATELTKKSSLLTQAIKSNKEDIGEAEKSLQALGKQYGINFTFDENGNIGNYEDQMAQLIARRNEYAQKAEKYAGTDQGAYWKDQYATIEQYIDKLSEGIDDYDELIDRDEDLNQSLKETNKEVLQNTINKFSKANEDFETYIGTLDEYKNLLELTNLDDDGKIIETLRDIQEVRRQSLEAAIEGFNQIRTAHGITDEEIQQAQQAALEAAKEYAAALKATVLEEIEGLGKELEKELTGGLSFDDVATSMERAQSLQEEYLTDTNKVYEVNKLINEAQKQIDATTNNSAKQKLKNFIEQTKELEKQNKLSKFELDIRKAEYDVTLAEIALQEAQQAKSTVRLRRDSEGNYGYVYTADENKVADAEQKLADAQNALYNIGLEGANNYTQKQAEIMRDFEDQAQALNEAWLNGEFESFEEYQKKLTELEEYTGQQYASVSELLAKATAIDTKIMSESWATALDLDLASAEKLKSSIDSYIQNTTAKLSKYNNDISQIATDSAVFDVLKDSAGKATTEAEKLNKALIGGDGKDGLDDSLSKINDQSNATANDGVSNYKDTTDKATESTDKLSDAINGDGKENKGAIQSLEDLGNKSEEMTTMIAGFGSVISDAAAAVNSLGKMIENVNGKTLTLSMRIDPIVGEEADKEYWKEPLKALKLEESLYTWNAPKQAVQMNTGGYTGSWGPEGRYAVLHEKEIVLSKEDTANLLASVELLRGIIDTLDLQTASSMIGGLLISPGQGVGHTTTTIDQNVKIEATFPNVQDHNEIEEAFNNLINQASQYANRK